MFGDIKNHFFKKIIPEYSNYIEYRSNHIFSNNNDIRIGLNSASGLFHFREYLPDEIKNSRSYFSDLCEDYNLLGDIVNVSKHNKINRNNPQIEDSKNIGEVLIVTTYKDEKGEYQFTVKEVEITLKNGERKFLSRILNNCINMWSDYLFENKIINKKFHFEISDEIPERPKDENLTIGAIQGLTISGFSIYLKKYNYEKNIAEPINLENSKIQFQVRLPDNCNYYNIDLIAPDGKEKIELEIILSDDEVERINEMSEEDRIKFTLQKAKEQNVEIKKLPTTVHRQ